MTIRIAPITRATERAAIIQIVFVLNNFVKMVFFFDESEAGSLLLGPTVAGLVSVDGFSDGFSGLSGTSGT